MKVGHKVEKQANLVYATNLSNLMIVTIMSYGKKLKKNKNGMVLNSTLQANNKV